MPVYQYVCYVSSYDVDAIELHEFYKQRSTSETWIEQVKGHTMAGNTLTETLGEEPTLILFPKGRYDFYL